MLVQQFERDAKIVKQPGRQVILPAMLRQPFDTPELPSHEPLSPANTYLDFCEFQDADHCLRPMLVGIYHRELDAPDILRDGNSVFLISAENSALDLLVGQAALPKLLLGADAYIPDILVFDDSDPALGR